MRLKSSDRHQVLNIRTCNLDKCLKQALYQKIMKRFFKRRTFEAPQNAMPRTHRKWWKILMKISRKQFIRNKFKV